MANTSQIEIQTAMYNALMPGGVLDATLAGAGLNAVYDLFNVPQNAPYDYLTIGDGYELTDHTFDSNGYLYYNTLHIWSVQRGTLQTSIMVDRLDQLFDRKTLALATLHSVYTLRQRCIWLADSQGVTPIQHVAIQYKSYSTQ